MLGICIRYFNHNYGGILQSYATVKYLERQGYDYEIIRYKKKKSIRYILASIPRLLNIVLLYEKYGVLQKKISGLCNKEYAQHNKQRYIEIEKYIDEHFRQLSPIYYGYDELKISAKKYSAVITGSDQLWSPSGLPTNFYNLMFVPDDIRKISIASSFGVQEIPWYQRKRTKKFLDRIEYISTREISGSVIVEKLSGRNVSTILDPVFLFNSSEWAQLVPIKDVLNEAYIFAYFLGNNKEYRDAVDEAAIELNCKIVTLRHLDEYIESDEEFGTFAPYDVDPERFLNLLRGAKYVCTDSFHGSVFSIIHHKKFVIFNRYKKDSKHSKNSRIDTLCEKLELHKRSFAAKELLSGQLLMDIDYEQVEKRLKVLKESTVAYLEMALKNVN